ncbi:MAG: hypothetical protein LBU99_04080 [Spirochaetaceae bacterium]|jgi:hypothetical protein|nr:hypothetical protein [Spirochaetaceae bacterium]
MYLMYCVYDVIANQFHPPIIARTDAQALRIFTSSVQNLPPESKQEDFELYCVGTFNPDSGVLTGYPEPVAVHFLTVDTRAEDGV